MPGVSDWSPYKTRMQGGLRDGNFLNAQFVLLAAGPPRVADIGDFESSGAAGEIAYPIGITQNVALSQNKAVSRIFEIGSERSYFICGRTIGQLSLSRVMYHGPSLLKSLYAYYGSDNSAGGTYAIDSLFESAGKSNPLNFPFTSTGSSSAPDTNESQVRIDGGLHQVRVPPGFDNLFLNLASDLFSQPIGLLLVFRDNNENDVASVYLENCYVPSSSLAFDSQGLIIQEAVSILYERIVPIEGTAVKVVDTIIPDIQGAAAY